LSDKQKAGSVGQGARSIGQPLLPSAPCSPPLALCFGLSIFSKFVENIIMITIEVTNIILSRMQKFDPQKVGIFGSFARGENKKGSDLDILVEFKKIPSLLALIKLENDLTEILGTRVDIVTTGALKNRRIKRSIKKDLISIL
jgi:uncharacterized protein